VSLFVSTTTRYALRERTAWIRRSAAAGLAASIAVHQRRVRCGAVQSRGRTRARSRDRTVRAVPVLRPGGLLIVGTPNEGCLMGRTRNRWIQPSIGRTTDHVHFFTDRTLAQALHDAGLRIVKIERETFFFRART